MREQMQETSRSARNQEIEIDLGKLFAAYLRRWWVIVLCLVVGAAIAAVWTTQFITPMYKASVTFYVNNSRNDQQVDSITTQSLNASQQLVNTYMTIIRSNTVMEAVAESLDTPMSVSELKSMVSVSQVDDTELFKVYVTSPDPEQAAYIANCIADVTPGQLEYFVEGSSTKIIDRAVVPDHPSSPSLKKNVAVGAVLGLVIALIVLTILHLRDVRIKEERDLTDLFPYPVLGQIPIITVDKTKAAALGDGANKDVKELTGGQTR